MPRVIALDFGLKRCGIAATDELQIIASALDTVETPKLREFLSNYLKKEPVEKLVIGQATAKDGSPNPLEIPIAALILYLQSEFPNLAIVRYDEHGSSLSARQIINFSVPKKKTRQDKSLVDRISAAIILQNYLGFY
jgi:putative holliday junction resolvase